MIRHVFDALGIKLLRAEEAEPVCSKDYCDSCGDCLACQSEDACYFSEDGEHYWVVYEDDGELDKAIIIKPVSPQP